MDMLTTVTGSAYPGLRPPPGRRRRGSSGSVATFIRVRQPGSLNKTLLIKYLNRVAGFALLKNCFLPVLVCMAYVITLLNNEKNA